MTAILPRMSWLDRIVGLLSLDLGIDLGTANTLVAVKGRGVILSEPSVVAVKKGTKQVIDGPTGEAVGDQAKIMLGKNPGNIDVIKPLKDGVIADLEITEHMLRYFIRKASGGRRLVPPRVVVAVPSGINEVENLERMRLTHGTQIADLLATVDGEPAKPRQLLQCAQVLEVPAVDQLQLLELLE